MSNKILTFSNDNVFYLLLTTLIKDRDENIICKKLMHVNELDENDKKDIDLIIVDGKMMTISPIQLIYELRYIHKITSAIWMFTIIDIPDYLEKVIEVGANKTIQKPFDPEEITNDIIAYIQTHSLKSTNNKRNI